MKLLLLANEAPEDFASRDDPTKVQSYMGEWYAFSEGLGKSGASQGGGALEPPSTATVVSVRNGERRVEDGPFPDGKEQLGGFFIIEAETIEAGAAIAAKCPAAKNGFVDVRVIPSLEDHGK